MEQNALALGCYVVKVSPDALIAFTRVDGNYTSYLAPLHKPDERIELPRNGAVESSYDPLYDVFVMRIPIEGLEGDVEVCWTVTHNAQPSDAPPP